MPHGPEHFNAANGDFQAPEDFGVPGVPEDVKCGHGKERGDCPLCWPEDVSFLVDEHGWNGDWNFTEHVDVVGSLEEAKEVAMRVMKTDRYRNVLPDGKPTVQWVEIFGPGIEESIGLEERDGELVWTP